MIEESGAHWSFVRPTLMMIKAAQWWATTIRTRIQVYFPGLKGRAPAVDPSDVAAVACEVLCRPQALENKVMR
jgi:uncharacterized protein YbjT (DUF2867 family)